MYAPYCFKKQWQLVVKCGQQSPPVRVSKSSYVLFCALIWNLSHFLPKFEFTLIQNSVSGSFSHVFHHWQELFRQLFRYYNHKSEL